MHPNKRTLDTEEGSDDESRGYDSEGAEPQKGGRRGRGRGLKVASSEKESFNCGEEAQVLQEEHFCSELDSQKRLGSLGKPSESTRNPIKLTLGATDKAIQMSGVVYISRIPPFMKLHKLRSLLEKYGIINRIFLAPEESAARTRRVRNSRNKRKLYTEGWVEFVNKKNAKEACELLNTRVIGRKKSGYYHDDVLNLRYLKNFKWNNLTEQIAAENAERACRMRVEISKQIKEDKDFVRNVEKGKIMKTRQAKAMRKEGASSTKAIPAQRWTFDQIPLAKTRAQDKQPEQVRRALEMIF
ncbi:uncharacterized protein LY89DRAFT_590501 [Mollisia scopiformis]|uniref:18S rRNA factor 2 n=1 Tax=Mollisia scopiformis TaxID=149040 RepID=A0A194X211_MOLSC|nr:uncharacterized protein LY89DRAFT_590501 [Mollisia scopiformis]KUJ13882.1 hypothetical protein LY89DRAFT_590501 [Mollisia scopiformis]